jgi:hypothetical protein
MRRPRRRRVAAAADLLALAGSTAGIRYAAVDADDAASARPHPSYCCYDCHGYRYFDPYYAGRKERVEGRPGGREKVREQNPPVPGYDGRL